MQLHPKFITKQGKKEFAVLPYEEFIALQERLEDLEDWMNLEVAKQEESEVASVSLKEIEQMFDIAN